MSLINLSDTTFDFVIKTRGVAVVYFTAPWSGIYAALKPTLEELATEEVKVYMVDVDDCIRISAKYNIRAIPTLLLFKDGEPAQLMPGVYRGKAEILDAIKKLQR